MRYIFRYLIVGIFTYLVCSINPAYLIGKRKGFDIRSRGSHNAGASNALITMGNLVFVFCMLFDISKAVFCIRTSMLLNPDTPFIFPFASVCALIGHIFPFYMNYKGGKGLAVLGGIIFSYSPIIFVIMLTAEIVFVAIVKYVCFVAMSASAVFPAVYYFTSKDIVGAIILLIIPVIVFAKHRTNIERIKNGTEARITYLFSREKEEDRLKTGKK